MVEAETPRRYCNLIPGLPDDLAAECLIRVPYTSHSEMGFVSRSWKALIASNSFYAERRRLSFSDRLLCLVQPLPTSQIHPPEPSGDVDCKPDTEQPTYGLTVYNATDQTWQRISTPQNSLHVPMFCHCVALPSSRKLLLLGGWDPQTLEPVSAVYSYNLITREWTRAASMSKARSFFACTAVGGNRVYVAGGHDSQKNALKSAEVYDADEDEWTTLPEMEQERDECHGMSWRDEDKFWVVSGYGTDCQGQFRHDAECYDPGTNSWTVVENVWPFAALSPRCTAAITGHKGREWHWFLGSQQLRLQELNSNEEGGSWDVARSVIRVPEGIDGSNLPCVAGFGLDGEGCDEVFVMGSDSKRPGAGGVCCAGEGAFILGRDKKWRHVHRPSAFAGSPYSASYLVL
uniref:F-box domain-containing protein n=1 Tax=Kalanchoe fedtschenkoi TaxID=63787 RepID=A0A7N1A327_KALFE